MKLILAARLLTFMWLLAGSTLSVSQAIDDEFENYHSVFPFEKAYLHLSKPHYRLGETIWFKAYLVDASTHRFETKSTVLQVELIDPNGNIVASKVLSTMHERMAGDFELEISLTPGPYTIRAYTNWMRNFDEDYFYSSTFNVFESNGLETFRKKDTVSEELTIAFFPEGGDLIGGLQNTVAMKAIDRSGRGVSVQGVVLDKNGERVSKFSTTELGFGKFSFNPNPGATYTAHVSTSTEDYYIELPGVFENGLRLSIENEFSSEEVKINLIGKGVDLMNSSILIHQRGAIKYFTSVNKSSNSFSMDLLKDELSPGVYHLTVFDKNNQPIAERVFAANLYRTNITASLTIDSLFSPGALVDASIEVTDLKERTQTGSVSASVTKENGYYYSFDQNIRNYLLLSSDLKGPIEKPSTYFNPTADAHNQLDLLMLTQGWKRFAWNEILSDSLKKVNFQAEENGITLKGQMVDFYNRKKTGEGYVSMSTITTSNPWKADTDHQGMFQIEGINFPDTIDLILNGYRIVNKKGKLKDDTFINIYQEEAPEISNTVLLTDLAATSIEELLEEMDSSDFTLLDEVIVKGKKEIKEVKDPFAKAKSRYLRPSIRIVADSVFKERVGVKNTAGFLRNIPGVAIIGSGPSTMVRLQGLGSQKRIVATVENMAPLYLIDGVPTSETSVFSLNPFDISYIDILRGTEASLYGTRGSNGVIAIYLRPAELAKKIPRPGSLFFQFPGYYAAKKFEFTDLMRSNLTKDPLGVTVYWNPTVKFSEGRGNFKFNLPEEPGNYFIRLEGITENGSPIFLEKSFKVE